MSTNPAISCRVVLRSVITGTHRHPQDFVFAASPPTRQFRAGAQKFYG
jgi:hypothetical protein